MINNYIKKLKQLKRLEPESKTLLSIKTQVFLEIDSLNNKQTRKFKKKIAKLSYWPRGFFYGTIVVVLLFFITIIGSKIFSSQFQTYVTSIKINFAANRYEKSRLALGLSQNLLQDFRTSDKNTSISQIQYLADAVTQTNSSLSSLKLNGEPGKYTKQQCLSLYKKYYFYLEEMNSTLNKKLQESNTSSAQQELESLHTKTTEYGKSVNKKLRFYEKSNPIEQT